MQNYVPKLIVLAFLASASALAAKLPADLLTAPGRTASDRARDESRKPVEVLGFLGVKKGDAALDYGAGGGYYSELLVRVVGTKGTVTAWDGGQFKGGEPLAAKWVSITTRHPNVRISKQPIDAFSAPAKSFSFALLHLVYHDLYWENEAEAMPRRDPDKLVKSLYAAMKPGGIVGIVDHAGPAGDTRAIVNATHRIDPAVVRADFERAGFKFVAQSTVLRSTTDDKAKDVFQQDIFGKSDRFIFKFMKPRK
jgi:predicted methyltransferase